MLSVIFLMAEARAYQRTRVVFGKFAWRKGSLMRPKALFLTYYANAPLIQLILLGPLKSRTKFEVFQQWWWIRLHNGVENILRCDFLGQTRRSIPQGILVQKDVVEQG